MAHLLLVCYRDRRNDPAFAARIANLNARMTPDHLTPRPAAQRFVDGAGLALLGGQFAADGSDLSAWVGMISPQADWAQVGAAAPDGSYALFRANADYLELLTDAAASRTIWYVHTPDLFLASTSQRMLIAWLGDFQRNPACYPWVLSCGGLGPDQAWDVRFHSMPVDCRLKLDRAAWQLTQEAQPVIFAPRALSLDEHKARLAHSIATAFDRFAMDPRQWVLALSGGYDSRAILLWLKNPAGMRSVTWGLPSAPQDPANDAAVARDLAAHYHLPHRYFPVDLSDEGVSAIFNRFLAVGEGRVENIGGYLDGFLTWKLLAEDGVTGILRGDEGFGWVPVNTVLDVRRYIGLMMLTDYANLQPFADLLPPQSLPELLCRQPRESLAAWRDRLYHSYRLPVVLAALNYLKASYLEIANPLLARDILYQVRQMPDALRTDKRLFKAIVQEKGPSIRFAQRSALDAPARYLHQDGVVDFLAAELENAAAGELLPVEMLAYIQANLRKGSGQRTASRNWLRSVLPRSIWRAVKNLIGAPHLDVNMLAFRAWMIVRMDALLREDATCLQADSVEAAHD